MGKNNISVNSKVVIVAEGNYFGERGVFVRKHSDELAHVRLDRDKSERYIPIDCIAQIIEREEPKNFFKKSEIKKFEEKVSKISEIITKNKEYLCYIVVACPEKDGVYQLSKNIIFDSNNWSIKTSGEGGEIYWFIETDLLSVIGNLSCHVTHGEIRGLWKKLEKGLEKIELC
jgi:hypothetical protein